MAGSSLIHGGGVTMTGAADVEDAEVDGVGTDGDEGAAGGGAGVDAVDTDGDGVCAGAAAT
jgi:hypothetical protein